MDPFPNMRRVSSWPAPTTPEEREALALQAFEEAERQARADPALLEGHRVLLAWRITREVARVRGLVREAQDLLRDVHRQYWTKTDKEREIPETPSTCEAVYHVQRLSYDVPLDFAAVPHGDRHRWVALAEFVAAFLAVPHTGPFRAALDQMLEDPALYWPTVRQVTEFEEKLVEAVSRKILRKSRAQVSRLLQREYSLLKHEANNLVLVATKEYRFLVAQDKEAERGYRIAQLEDFARRSREAMHLREELQAQKEINMVLGIKQAEPPPEEEDMTGTIERVCGEEDSADRDVGPGE